MSVALSGVRSEQNVPFFNVIGVDLPTPEGRQRINAINAGTFPFETVDCELSDAATQGTKVGNLVATDDPAVYQQCDVVVVDVHLDVCFDSNPPTAKMESFRSAIREIGKRIKPETLVLIETTVPPGTTEFVALPVLQKAFEQRGLEPGDVLLAHSYERVMPGKDYLSSITNIWRVYSGCNEKAAERCRKFLEKFINTGEYPLTRLQRPLESEVAKLMENSFRAVNIALVDEWSRFAERTGINMDAITDAIRMRPTHRNIMKPGFGVGGYCLTKDPLLVGVGAREILKVSDIEFPFCQLAVEVNQRMPLATLSLISREIGSVKGVRVLLLGVSYRENVADARCSPSLDLIRMVQGEGGEIVLHDPLMGGTKVDGLDILRELPPDRDAFDAVVFAVKHSAYLNLDPANWRGAGHQLVIDANLVLNEAQIATFKKLGCRVKVIGRGDL